MPNRNDEALNNQRQFQTAVHANGPAATVAAGQVVTVLKQLPNISPELGVALITMATASLDCLLDGFLDEDGDGPAYHEASLWVALDALVDEYVALRDLILAEEVRRL